MFRRLAVLSIALTASGCLHTAEEEASARDAWGNCVADTVKKLDDGRSDPASLAYGIAPQCAVYYSRLTEIMVGKNITENGQAFAREDMQRNEIRLITAAILIFRAKHPGKNNPV